MDGKIIELPASSATVELAAKALSVEPCRIAKTLSFRAGDKVVLVVAAGDARVDNRNRGARGGRCVSVCGQRRRRGLPRRVAQKI